MRKNSRYLYPFLFLTWLVLALFFAVSSVRADYCSGTVSKNYYQYICIWNPYQNKNECKLDSSHTDTQSCAFYPGTTTCYGGPCGACLACGQVCTDGTATTMCDIRAEAGCVASGICTGNSVWSGSTCSCNSSSSSSSSSSSVTPPPGASPTSGPSPTPAPTAPPACPAGEFECHNGGTCCRSSSQYTPDSCSCAAAACAGSCLKSNPFDPEDIWHGGPYGVSQCDSVYLPGHYQWWPGGTSGAAM